MIPFPLNFWANVVRQVVLQTLESLLNVSETIALDLDITLNESVDLIDELTVDKINRIVLKTVMESLLNISEAISLTRDISTSETVNLIDELTKFSEPRAKQKTLESLLNVSEQIDLTITPTTPTISSCSAQEAGSCDSTFDVWPGNNCNSILVYLSVNGGAFNFHTSYNTTPNGSNIQAYQGGLSNGDVVRWRADPYSLSNGGGTQGSSCTSGFVDITLC